LRWPGKQNIRVSLYSTTLTLCDLKTVHWPTRMKRLWSQNTVLSRILDGYRMAHSVQLATFDGQASATQLQLAVRGVHDLPAQIQLATFSL